MCEITLQEVFALIPATVLHYIGFGLKILLKTLKELPDASICWPRDQDFVKYFDLITV
jgi:hypothetical protein